ncbi:MBL fold metallo-hydrolase [Vulgatibacter incomptus]|uniref:AttM/AiiB family protein n=1 Tax=Vulgatibacter incomptus TaxID=1391653 RepID=A0A0K1PEU4_9BACT|nr:MBL fold metallo-hydrolase [Vulgatibacter incomptus]AKU91639.1 AttM/AiiB family protein [Vulgatibacter incomptus]
MKTLRTTIRLAVLLGMAAACGCGAHRPAEARFHGDVAAWNGEAPGEVEVIPMVTGEIEVDRSLLVDLSHPEMAGRKDDKVWVPVMAYLVRHPTKGDVLIDSGFDSSFAASGHGNFGGLAKLLNIARQKPGHDTASLLRQLGVEPASLKMILLSHMHPDHTAGLPELPTSVPVIAGPGAMASYEVLWYAPQDHLAGRETIENLDIAPGEMRDLFGDGSLVVVSTPGHAAGNLSFLVHTARGATLLTCDASHTREGLDHGVAPGKNSDANASNESIGRLRRFLADHPEVKVKAGHDAADWDLERGIQDPL